jgi:hypothetical protein
MMHSSQHMNEILGLTYGRRISVWTVTESQKQLSEKMGVVIKDVIHVLNFTNMKSLARCTKILPRIHAFNL